MVKRVFRKYGVVLKLGDVVSHDEAEKSRATAQAMTFGEAASTASALRAPAAPAGCSVSL